jgi:hypothetical protein
MRAPRSPLFVLAASLLMGGCLGTSVGNPNQDGTDAGDTSSNMDAADMAGDPAVDLSTEDLIEDTDVMADLGDSAPDDLQDSEITPAYTVTINWTLVAGEAQTPASCPAGSELIVWLQDVQGYFPALMQQFSCSDVGTTTFDVTELATYAAWIDLVDGEETRLAASFPVDVDLLGDPTVDLTINLTHAFIGFSWAITIDSAPATCAEANAVDVLLAAERLDEDPVTFTTAMACDLEQGMSGPLPLGEYQVTVVLRGADTNPLVTSLPTGVVLDYGNELELIGTVPLALP